MRTSVSWYLPRRWSAVAVAQAEQNDELDLDHRFTGGGVMNRAFAQSNEMEFTSGAGLVATQEQFSSATGSTAKTSIEGLVLMNWSAFRFDSPKLDFTTSVGLFPSLSDWGRLRGQADFRLKYELFNLKNDPFESTNLAEQEPAQLRRLMQGMIEKLAAQKAVFPVAEDGKTELRPELPKE